MRFPFGSAYGPGIIGIPALGQPLNDADYFAEALLHLNATLSRK